MADEPCIATKMIDIEACGGPRRRKERKGLEVRAARVDPPDQKPRGTPPLSMMASHGTRPARDPLDWMLLTTEGDGTAADALKTVSFYERRWWIEEYFKALKVGTRIEDRPGRRSEEVPGLRRHHRMPRHERLARPTPRPVTSSTATRSRSLPSTRPADSARRVDLPNRPAFAVEVARLAGFIPRKRQPLPGTEKLWQGYKLLLNFVEHHRTMRKLDMLKEMDLTVSG